MIKDRTLEFAAKKVISVPVNTMERTISEGEGIHGLDMKRVQYYVKQIKKGIKLPPVEGIKMDDWRRKQHNSPSNIDWLLSDGNHRHKAAEVTGLKNLDLVEYKLTNERFLKYLDAMENMR